MWIIDGRVYDLDQFAKLHPGGSTLIDHTRGRDVSSIFYSQHKNPDRLLPILGKYLKEGEAELSFSDEKGVLKELHETLDQTEWKERLVWADFCFGLLTLGVYFCYIGVEYRGLAGRVKALPFGVLMAASRMAVRSVSTAALYRHQSIFGICQTFLKDIDYGNSAWTDHHHRLRNNRCDVNPLDDLATVANVLKVPMYSIRRLLFPIDALSVFFQRHKASWTQITAYVSIRMLLVVEVVVYWQKARANCWIAQFVITSMLSLLLETSISTDPRQGSGINWAEQVLRTTSDLTVTRNNFLDAILTCGYSCHRARSLLPCLRSPFSCIAVDPLIKQVAAEKQIELKESVSLDEKLSLILRNFLEARQIKISESQIWSYLLGRFESN